MGKLAVLIVILMLGVLALFAVHNYDTTSIVVPFGQPHEISKIGVILFSSVFGALATLVIFFIRDTRRFMVTYQYQRKQKREEKIQSLYSQAVNAILAGDEAEARSALENILRIEPEHRDALLRRGDVAASREQYEEAANYYKRARTASPGSLEALFSLENVMERMKRWDEALEYSDAVLEVDPDNLSALYRKRRLLEREGRWDDVIDVQKAVLKQALAEKVKERERANMMGYRYELARESLERGETEKANKGFRALMRDEDHFVPAHLGVTEVLLAEGESEGAASYLEKAYETTSSIILLARLEDLLISLGEPSRLIRTYRRAVSQHPNEERLKFFLGKLYFRLEMIDDAMEALSSLDASACFPDLCRLLGELYLRRDQCSEAVEYFRKTMDSRTMRLPYTCTVCGYSEPKWEGRCPGCGNWNTYEFTLQGLGKV
jgi:lipopolysaccharide biosynthesis regulator YciM